MLIGLCEKVGWWFNQEHYLNLENYHTSYKSYICLGYAWVEDKEHCEEYGRMLNADPSKVSLRAKKRGLPQV